jgi:predicted Zn-ribbon and HTH transcriptional regulator
MNSEWIPEQREQTIRREILASLEQDRLSAAELSRLVHKPEKEVYHHLEELKKAGKIRLLPPLCAECGFAFEERRKTKKPGKCPRCKSTRIKPPLFALSGQEQR